MVVERKHVWAAAWLVLFAVSFWLDHAFQNRRAFIRASSEQALLEPIRGFTPTALKLGDVPYGQYLKYQREGCQPVYVLYFQDGQAMWADVFKAHHIRRGAQTQEFYYWNGRVLSSTPPSGLDTLFAKMRISLARWSGDFDPLRVSALMYQPTLQKTPSDASCQWTSMAQPKE